MQIKTLIVGELCTNCYLITKNDKTIIIDPGSEIEKIISECLDKQVVGILVTHHHFDHIGALKELEQYYSVTHNPEKIEGFNYQIIKNPGHTEDSQSFYFKEDKILFAGDFIFYHSIGRCDLEGGSLSEMSKSIQIILTYPQDIRIYPGHGPQTTLEEEIPYLKYFMKKISPS